MGCVFTALVLRVQRAARCLLAAPAAWIVATAKNSTVVATKTCCSLLLLRKQRQTAPPPSHNPLLAISSVCFSLHLLYICIMLLLDKAMISICSSLSDRVCHVCVVCV
jgi:hypothetical protein